MNILSASAVSVFQYIGYVLLAIVILLVMITVHEFGHYIAGKLLGFKINEFAIGFGPKLFKKAKKNGEVFSVRAFPLGGFCAFYGEEEDKEDKEAYLNQKPYKRIIVLVSGALMNLILAFVVIALMFAVYGEQRVRVVKTAESVPSGYTDFMLEDGDVIDRVNGRYIVFANDLDVALKGKKAGDTVKVSVLRNGKYKTLQVKLVRDITGNSSEHYGALGIGEEFDESGKLIRINATTGNVRFGFFKTIGDCFVYHFKLASSIFRVIGQLLTGKLGLTSLGGPITTVKQTANMVRVGGFASFLQITAFIGVNLGVFNLLPLPALDGSHVVFTLIEWIRKKPINRKAEAIIHLCGFIFLLGFAVLVDVLQFFA